MFSISLTRYRINQHFILVFKLKNLRKRNKSVLVEIMQSEQGESLKKYAKVRKSTEYDKLGSIVVIFFLKNSTLGHLFRHQPLSIRAKSVFSKKRLFVLLIKLFFIPLHADAAICLSGGACTILWKIINKRLLLFGTS